MADLTNLESKIAEVLGLAAASKTATEKVKSMLEDDEQDLAGILEQMGQEAARDRAALQPARGQLRR